jgi:Holliday junction DNA helicase RuvA
MAMFFIKEMIAYLEGNFTQRTPTFIVVDIHGIGYQVNISLNTYEKVANLEKGKLLTHFIVKEDGHSLYGFYEEGERSLFRHLISISGVGPNTARTMLSSLNPEEIKKAIVRGDVSFLKTIKGIGPKSAQRIIVELQDVLSKDAPENYSSLPVKNRTVDEALTAMVMLGFSKPQSEKAIDRVLKENPENISVENIIKQALRMI